MTNLRKRFSLLWSGNLSLTAQRRDINDFHMFGNAKTSFIVSSNPNLPIKHVPKPKFTAAKTRCSKAPEKIHGIRETLAKVIDEFNLISARLDRINVQIEFQ